MRKRTPVALALGHRCWVQSTDVVCFQEHICIDPCVVLLEQGGTILASSFHQHLFATRMEFEVWGDVIDLHRHLYASENGQA